MKRSVRVTVSLLSSLALSCSDETKPRYWHCVDAAGRMAPREICEWLEARKHHDPALTLYVPDHFWWGTSTHVHYTPGYVVTGGYIHSPSPSIKPSPTLVARGSFGVIASGRGAGA